MARSTADKNTEVVLVKPAFVYNGEVQQPQIVTIDGRYLIKGKDYSVKLAKQPKNVGTYTMTIQGKGNFTGKTKATFRIRKADNSLQVTGKTATVKYKKLKKKAKVLKASQVYDFTDPGEGSRTYKLISAAKDEKNFTKAFKVNAKNGKVTVRRKTKKGTDCDLPDRGSSVTDPHSPAQKEKVKDDTDHIGRKTTA